MSLLELKKIGKIYAQNGNVAVGIRGVDLTFDRGEFVAITGESGSGKSTLLNVLSGMDTYEEGEMLVEGLPTSHYLQPDWEEYRKKYISFIFQDYNIIESFTVLQNVELALMHIESKKERRERALELLDRVGLTRAVHQKGSRLSGGQKQRTVIARALAKDSPIILADEPTGNLDAQTSKEIIALLREVSKDKLLIVVTHSFDEVEDFATREIRVFDGAVESDRRICTPNVVSTPIEEPMSLGKKHDLKNGITLGATIFRSKPLLSIFICLLLLVGTLGVTFLSSICSGAVELFKDRYQFNTIDGRVVVARRDGNCFSEDEISGLVSDTGAKKYIKPDFLFEESLTVKHTYFEEKNGINIQMENKIDGCRVVINGDFGEDIVGRYPQKPSEIFMYIPLSHKMGKYASESGEFEPFDVTVNGSELTVCGFKIFRNTNKTPYISVNEDGFKLLSALLSLSSTPETEWYMYTVMSSGVDLQPTARLTFSAPVKIPVELPFEDSDKGDASFEIEEMIVGGFDARFFRYSKNLNDNEVVFECKNGMVTFDKSQDTKCDLDITVYSNIGAGRNRKHMEFVSSFENVKCEIKEGNFDETCVVVGDRFLIDIFDEAVNDAENGYFQMSLFVDSNAEARKVAQKLTGDEYIAVSSDTKRDPGLVEMLSSIFSGLFMGILWILGLVFIAFFVYICSARTVNSFTGEMAIMRSMGIPVKAIKIGMYVRMIISEIPSIVITAVLAYIGFSIPSVSASLSYIEWYTYILIFIGIAVVVARVTKKLVKRLFNESVKKAIRRGNEA